MDFTHYIQQRKNKYSGIINNIPAFTKLVKQDDIVEIELSEISDWMYFEGNVLKGGSTIRLLRDRMSEKDRINFDKESGYKFE